MCCFGTCTCHCQPLWLCSILSLKPSLTPFASLLAPTGAHEGAFAWLTLNYLLGNLGGQASDTIAAIDLGGGSVQEAFALAPEQANRAPEGYVTQLKGAGVTYDVYVHR